MIYDIIPKLEEQTKLNDDICKRMCEFKEQIFN